jgi:hypothetical protein
MPAKLAEEERKKRAKERMRRWRQRNQAHILAYKRLDYAKNRERILARQRELTTPDKKARSAAYYKRWRQAPEARAKLLNISRKWRSENRERDNKLKAESFRRRYPERKEALRKWRQLPHILPRRQAYIRMRNSLAQVKIAKKKWYDANRSKVTRYVRVRRQNDVAFRILCSLRRRINEALRGKHKSARTLELLGCNIEELRRHLASKFSGGMDWDNYGRTGWHLDHIIPCNRFNLLDAAEQRLCFHFSNLQPLWAKDNLRKQDRTDWLPSY